LSAELGVVVITIELDDDEALVVFELLTRNDDRDNVSSINELTFEDTAERYALWHVHAALERTLVAPFKPAYRALVEDARRAVRARWGEAESST
jgi:hypothetical protein